MDGFEMIRLRDLFLVPLAANGPRVLRTGLLGVGTGVTLVALATALLFDTDAGGERSAIVFLLGVPGAVLTSMYFVIALLGVVYCGVERHHRLQKHQADDDA